MASIIVHLAVCGELLKRLPVRDPDRFRIGHILPDTVPGEIKRQVNSHFIRSENGYKIFDAWGFLERYEREVGEDDLYLGYYLHLLQDNAFRRVLYYDLGLLAHRGEKGLFDELYLDYNKLNVPLGLSYGVTADIPLPEDMESLRIMEIYPFDIRGTLDTVAAQLREPVPGEPVRFTRQVADSYIAGAVDMCVSEYAAMQQGGHALGRWDMAIEDVYSPLAQI